ncbi:hypothetical protein [Kitasatospora sp. NPDC051914]|uniref:hypothetical protein n=1 Tax=Kitasatospora sp. NPDC051914 TaxID=3154945 RepID=UPI003437E6C3
MNLARANHGTPPVHGQVWMLRCASQVDRAALQTPVLPAGTGDGSAVPPGARGCG